ncbi:MAG: DUF2800 domain-containing protein [Clostridia bacterium]|nr:DUF2800 domain-containing protein [Clostridia bacterium]
MSAHALLSPSSAHRWMNCTPAPRLEAKLPEKTSDFAREGTVAHSVCEITAKLHFGKVRKTEYTKKIKQLKTSELWDDEMLQTAETYVEHLSEKAMQFDHEPYLAFETKVDITDFVPEAFGRCDCIMFGGDTLIITDYKHGKGVPVSAEENPQMMLYALGALKIYRPLFGGAIKNVEIIIDQPRINSYEQWRCTADELTAWGESIKPIAQKAYMGVGEYKAGSWCQFCRANGICKAQAEQQTSAFDDFKDANTGEPRELLSPEEMGEALERGKSLVEWFNSIQQKALEALLAGTKIPGYKLVEGRSQRAWSDQDKALEKLMASGVERAVIYDSVPKSLAQLEKLLGAAKFGEIVGEFVTKPQGKPTLAPESDKRAEFKSAVADFAAVAESKESK